MSNKDFLKHLGMELKIARVRLNMERIDVAEKTGLCVATIGSIERGNEDSKILSYKRIADCLGVSLIEILNFAG